MFQFKVKNSVKEVRDSLQKMVSRGVLTENKMIKIIKKFAEEKTKVQDGQVFIIVMEEV